MAKVSNKSFYASQNTNNRHSQQSRANAHPMKPVAITRIRTRVKNLSNLLMKEHTRHTLGCKTFTLIVIYMPFQLPSDIAFQTLCFTAIVTILIER